MASDLILAIDQGTTGTTALLLDTNFQVVARSTVDFPQHYPQPGWVEHDPEEIWQSVVQAIAKVMRQDLRKRVAAVGVTNQRETCLIWERQSGRAIAPAIVWQDRRTTAACETLRAQDLEPGIFAKTGLRIDPYFSASKLEWLLEQHDPQRQRARSGEWAAGTIDTYLLWRLTAGERHVTDPSNASRTLLWPLKGKVGGIGWEDELLTLFGVPRSLLPEVVANAGVIGHTRGVPGLPDGLPIAGLAGDQQASLFGQACFTAGMAKCTYGTGAFALLQLGTTPIHSQHGLLTTVAWQLGEEVHYALEGSAFMAGAVVQWLRDGLQIISKSEEIEDLAAAVPDSGGVVLVPAHAGLGAPHWRPEARGLITGLTRATTKAHLARAALEGIALEVGDLIEAMSQDSGQPLAQLRVDGGAAANDLLMQMQADRLQQPLVRPAMLETTALGAAMLAALGVGMCSSLDELGARWQAQRRFEPRPEGCDPQLLQRWKAAIAKA